MATMKHDPEGMLAWAAEKARALAATWRSPAHNSTDPDRVADLVEKLADEIENGPPPE